MPVAQISVSSCIELRSNPGFYLRKDAGNAWDRACAAFGKVVILTGAWRSYETQERLFDGEKFPNQTPQYGRYSRGNRSNQDGYTNDVRWWPAKGSYWTRKAGTAAAAVPGTSNHGGGVAVDAKTRREDGDPGYDEAVIFAGWDDEDRARFLRIAAEHGWADDEGEQVGEHWHLTYYPDRDQHRGEAVPEPPQKETFLMALSDKKQQEMASDANVAAIASKQAVTKLERIEDDLAVRRAADLKHQRASAARETVLVQLVRELGSAAGVDTDRIIESLTETVRETLSDPDFELVLTPKETS